MIRYYIPADGDDAQHPNIFHLPPNVSQQQRAPTLRDVRQVSQQTDLVRVCVPCTEQASPTPS